MKAPLLLSLCWLAASAPVRAGDFRLYPDSDTSYNPRVPCVPPVERADGGRMMGVEAQFRYTFAPYVSFSQGGKLEADVRATARRLEQKILTLEGHGVALVFQIAKASEGGMPTLAVMKGDRVVASAAWPQKLPQHWTRVRLGWQGGEARLIVADGEPVKVTMPQDFAPASLTVAIAQIDEVKLDGLGSLSLGWQEGYAALLTPDPAAKNVSARLLGFDTYVISRDPTRRDCPTVQVSNAGTEPQKVKLTYDMTSEVAGGELQWTQEVTANPGSSVEAPIDLPEQMPSDVYHLSIHAEGLTAPLKETRHFLRVEPRDEPLGTPKFGLHESARRDFGFWPDALPIKLCHLYAYWGYIVGPAWISDPGMGPDTSPEEWNWSPMVDWAVGQGLTPYLSVQSTPFAEWMRARRYPRMNKYAWGEAGGFGRMELYRKFVAGLAQKYQGKVRKYEVENEPMAYLGGIPPEDYVQIAQVVGEEVHAADPQAKVYGICGTGDFVPWMRKVFALGGDKWMDAVAVHTYVTPSMPEAANLPGKLADVSEIIAKSGRNLPILNSETGTYVALREEVDRPIPAKRLQELIDAGNPGLSEHGWPFRAITERDGSISVVRNAVYNFLSKAEYFTFFGYNPNWPKEGWFTETEGDPCWAVVSATKDGVRTPSHYTLSIAVLTEQLKGAHQSEAQTLDESGIVGGLFPKEDGGEVAVIWSPLGKRSALVETQGDSLEVVSMLGQRRLLQGRKAAGRSVFRLEVGDEPIYLHTREPGLRLLPSPVLGVKQELAEGSTSRFQFTLINRGLAPWQGEVKLTSDQGWKVTPSTAAFSLAPGKRATVQGQAEIPADASRGSYAVTAETQLADGTPFSFPITLEIRPSFTVASVGADFAWDQVGAWQEIKPVLRIDRPEQAVIGRPPLMASLQEEKYWKGPDELSARTTVAANADALFIQTVVTDSQIREPQSWPGVLGSCVEFFIDGRSPANGLGSGAYTSEVHQLLVKPTANGVELFDATSKIAPLEGVTAAGGRLADNRYWVVVRVPWSSLKGHGQAIGFDVGINGPPPGEAARKTQLMLFGTASNSTDASAFGLSRLPETR